MLRLQRFNHFQSDGGRRWSVAGVIPPGLTVLWGPPGTGKTFVSVSMAVSVATGRPWIGRHTEQGRVVYIVGEGGAETAARRVRAAVRAWGVDPWEENIALDLVTPGPNLTGSAEELLRAVGEEAPRLLVVDTVSRCFVGDENAQEDMGRFVANVDRLRDVYGENCSILLIHHTNKKGKMRGSTVLDGAVDASWRLAKQRGAAPQDGSRVLDMMAEKLRERDVEGAKIKLRTVRVEDLDEAGEPLLDELGDVQTSLVVKPTKDLLEDAQRVRDAGELLALAMPDGIAYSMWRQGCAKLSKAEFDAALSMVLSYPGDWGGFEQTQPGLFTRA